MTEPRLRRTFRIAAGALWPYLGPTTALAVLLAALLPMLSDSVPLKRFVWSLTLVLPPAWLLVEWNYLVSEETKNDEQKRAAFSYGQSLVVTVWAGVSAGLGLLYFGPEILRKIAG